MNCLRYLYIGCFHSRGKHLCKFIKTKESLCVRKEFNSQRILLGNQHGRHFIVLGHHYGRPHVMWKHSISHVSVLIQIIVPAFFILYYYFWSLNNDPLNPHTNPCNISVMQHRFSFMTLEYLWRPVYIHNIQSVFQLFLGGHLDNLRGHPDQVLIFFVIFNLTFIFHLSSQEAFLVGPLTRDPSLIWNIDSAG